MSRDAAANPVPSDDDDDDDETPEVIQRKIDEQVKKCVAARVLAESEDRPSLFQLADAEDNKLHYLQVALLPVGNRLHRSICRKRKQLAAMREERQRLVAEYKRIPRRLRTLRVDMPRLSREITEDVQRMMKWTRRDEKKGK